MTLLVLRDEMNRDLAAVPEELVSFDELLIFLAETEVGLRRFIAAGVVKPEPDGRFWLKASITAYTGYWERVIAEQDAGIATIGPQSQA